MVESTGIHHVTAISGDLQETVDSYAGRLGLRATHVGERLMLPARLEPRREHLEEALAPIRIPSRPHGVTA